MSTFQCQPPWLSWFTKLDNDDAIKRAAYQRVGVIEGLQELYVEVACRQLELAWKEVFVPGTARLDNWEVQL
jgi:hypothetical protein